MQEDMLSAERDLTTYSALPDESMPVKDVKEILLKYKDLEHVDWQGGRVSGVEPHPVV